MNKWTKRLSNLFVFVVLVLPSFGQAAPGDGLPRILEDIAARLRAHPSELELKLVVGLGNSGSPYQNTRHNAGFLASDHLIEAWGAYGSRDRDPHFAVIEETALKYDDGEVVHEKIRYRTESATFRTELGEVFLSERFPGKLVVIARPFYDINESGKFVGEIVRYFNQAPLRLPPASIAVIGDNVDLAPGQLKLKAGGSAGGHNGIRSIDEAVTPILGNADYYRYKIGIGRPPKDGEWIGDYVVAPFSAAERSGLEITFAQVEESLRPFLAGNAAVAVQVANAKPSPAALAAGCNGPLHRKMN